MGLPETAEGETPGDRESRSFRDADEYPEIDDRYVSPKLEMILCLCYKFIAARGSTSGADVRDGDHFGASEWGYWGRNPNIMPSLGDSLSAD